MSSAIYNSVDPSNILAALYTEAKPEQVVSLQFHCVARSSWQGQDDWFLINQALSRKEVYDAFGIPSLPPRFDFGTSRGLEVIGTLANILDQGGIHNTFVDGFEAALAESRLCLDGFFHRDYSCAVAYSVHQAWCQWFIGGGILDETVLFRSGDDWWLLAVTGTD